MQVNFSNVQRSTSRLQVSVQASDPSQQNSQIQLKASPPSTGATFGRRLLNLVTFGSYTKYHENPSQWRAFRNAMIADLKFSDPEMNNETAKVTAKRLLAGYNPHKRLTAAKINNALADLARWQAGESHCLGNPQRANASQAAIARGLNSLKERCRNLSADENRLVQHAHDLLEVHEQQIAEDFAQVMSFSEVDPQMAEAKPLLSSEKPMVEGENSELRGQRHLGSDSFFEETRVKKRSLAKEEPATHPPVDSDAARAVLNILKPGRQIDALALDPGMKALKNYAQSKKVNFASVPLSLMDPNAKDRIDEAIEFLKSVNHQDNAEKPKLLALPLGLLAKPRSLQENHSVLIALDIPKKQVLYLDAKGHSIEYAMKEYGNAQDLKSQLKRLGEFAFGKEWNAETGVLQLTQAKQQGANDCVAFTHDFTRQLIDGKSVGDIERTMTAADRRQVRVKMAQDIDQYVLGVPVPTK